jgi:hypothetical protein
MKLLPRGDDPLGMIIATLLALVLVGMAALIVVR